MRILVVEDDFISRRLLCRYLDPFGTCEVAVNGKEAVLAFRHALTRKEPYELICLDIMMPDKDGIETLQDLRALEDEFGIGLDDGAKVMMTTALEDNRSVTKAFRARCDGYVVKPIDRKLFLQTLQDMGLPISVTSSR